MGYSAEVRFPRSTSMSKSRRKFLTETAAGIAGLAAAGRAIADTVPTPRATPAAPPPGMPPAFGTAPAVGPEVSAATFAEAEKLMQVTHAPAESAPMAPNSRQPLR